MEAPHHDHLTANQMPILEVGRQIQSQCRDLDQYELVIVLERTRHSADTYLKLLKTAHKNKQPLARRGCPFQPATCTGT